MSWLNKVLTRETAWLCAGSYYTDQRLVEQLWYTHECTILRFKKHSKREFGQLPLFVWRHERIDLKATSVCRWILTDVSVLQPIIKKYVSQTDFVCTGCHVQLFTCWKFCLALCKLVRTSPKEKPVHGGNASSLSYYRDVFCSIANRFNPSNRCELATK